MTNTFVFRPINMKATGRRIRDCRTARNLTVEQLSTLFCISPQAVCKWQRGDALPTIDNLMVLCDLFQVKVEDLIVRDDDGSSVFCLLLRATGAADRIVRTDIFGGTVIYFLVFFCEFC